MGKFVDLTGKRFGRLIVLKRNGLAKDKCILWECQCDCGNITLVRGNNLKNGTTKSCGCLARELAIKNNTKHNMSNTRFYNIWQCMKRRCYDPKHECYHNYGGRGIVICDEWLHDFKSFSDWALANGYNDNLSIDRIDNNKGYSPDNCRWATRLEQQTHTRNNIRVEYNGENHTLSKWSRIKNIKPRLSWK